MSNLFMRSFVIILSMGIKADVLQQLADLEPGRIPLDLFNAMARLTVTPVVEIAPLYNNVGVLSVLLCKRPEDDPLWPGQYHLPGTIVGAQDRPGGYSDAFSRILNGRLRDVQTTEPIFVGSEIVKTARGAEIALIHWAEILVNPKKDTLFPVDELPSDMIEGHPNFILMAIASYTAARS